MLHEIVDRLRPIRTLLLATFDTIAWLASFVAISSMQVLVGDKQAASVLHALVLGCGCAGLFLVLGAAVRLHQGRAAVGSFEDALLVTTVAGAAGALDLVAYLVVRGPQNGVLLVTGPITAIILMIWGRGAHRAMREQRFGRSGHRGAEPALVIGVGEGGRQLVHSMSGDNQSRWRPVGFVDDDLAKRHRRIRGISVLGTTQQLADIADRTGVRTAIIAIPSAPADVIRQISHRAAQAGLEVKILPSVGELLHPARAAISDIRAIDVTDLLGRHVVDTDLVSIAGYLTGKRVLVTGAGGSIGSELCRQIAEFDPAELIMLDRDESALHAVELSIYGKAMLDTDEPVLGDIRDTQFVLDLFDRRKPQVVFHAAALKHLPLLEKAPGEAIKTNVWGTLTILEAAVNAGVERFVNISTDKAANPCSVLGYSKRLAEGLTATVAAKASGTYLSVRFGNVLGSRGSVLTAFTSQIGHGCPVTVTDRHMTRYFMTIAEAVQLVIQAGAIGDDSEVLVLDMGEPVSIDSVARQLIELSGKRVEVVYTGMRPGEKMHEELFADGELDERPVHELISHTAVPFYTSEEARRLDAWQEAPEIAKQLS
ncbi:MAG: polysaccharide biosynthesis protein, partial [Propionibacteriaceae bacterium]